MKKFFGELINFSWSPNHKIVIFITENECLKY